MLLVNQKEINKQILRLIKRDNYQNNDPKPPTSQKKIQEGGQVIKGVWVIHNIITKEVNYTSIGDDKKKKKKKKRSM